MHIYTSRSGVYKEAGGSLSSLVVSLADSMEIDSGRQLPSSLASICTHTSCEHAHIILHKGTVFLF